jgi:hypothetical protein
MALTEEEKIDYCVYPGLFTAEVATVVLQRLNIEITEEIQNRLNMIYDSCNGLWHHEIDFLLYPLFGGPPGFPGYPCLDGLLFSTVWAVFGTPDVDVQIPWGDEQVYAGISAAITSVDSNQYALEHIRYIFTQNIIGLGAQ